MATTRSNNKKNNKQETVQATQDFLNREKKIVL